MVKKIFLILCMTMLTEVATAGKVAIFDANIAIRLTQFAQNKFAAFEATPEFAKMKADFEGFNAELEILNKELNAKSMTWSEEEKKKHIEKMDIAAHNRKLAMQRIKAEENKLLKSVVDKYQPVLKETVENYMKKNGIDMALRPESVSVLLDKELDVTTAIAAELDKIK